MARNRKATNVLELKGSFKKNPNRARKNEPIPEGEFTKTPPKHLSAEQKKAWREVLGLVPAGVLTSADPLTVEMVSVLLVEFREMSKGLKKFENGLLTRLCTEMDKIGLSPSGRAKLSVEKPKENKFKK